jgi:hypothetical protein
MVAARTADQRKAPPGRGGGPRTAVPSPAAGKSDADLIRLQRRAGNQAVVRLVVGTEGTGEVHTPRRARASVPVPVQRDLSVVIDLTADAKIEKVIIVGRPPHPFSGGEGSHTTSWAVYGDTVRRALVGKTVREAAAALKRLARATIEHAPGARSLDQQKRLLDATAPRQRAFGERYAAMGDALAKVLSGDASRRFECLQDAVSHYLAARNLAPLAGAYLGPADAVGGGEPTALDAVRAFEQDTSLADARTLRDALWKLLDPRTLGFAAGQVTHEALPGGKGTAAERVASIISRHLHEIAHAYPKSYNASGLATWTVVQEMYAAMDSQLGLPALPARRPAGLVLARFNSQAAAAPVGWSRSGDEPAEPFAVQIRTKGDGTRQRVADVVISGRAPTLLGAEGQGHHLTAHIVVVRALRRAVLEKRLPAAKAGLLALVAAADRLPSMPTTRPRRGNPQAADRLDSGEDPRGTFAAARTELAQASVATQGAAFTEHPVGALQRLAAAYLAMRNAMPLAALSRGSPAGSGGETRHLRALDGHERRPGKRDDIRDHMWGLVDQPALVDLYSLGGVNRRAVAPGAPDDDVDRLIAAVGTHLDTLEAAWPDAFAAAGMRSTGAVLHLIDTLGLAVPDDAMSRFVGRLGLARNDACRRAPPASGKDEAEYAPPAKRARIEPQAATDHAPPRQSGRRRTATSRFDPVEK